MSKASKSKKQTETITDTSVEAKPAVTAKKTSNAKNKKQPQVITDSPIAAEPTVISEIEVIEVIVPEIVQPEAVENLSNSTPAEDTIVTAIVPQEVAIEPPAQPVVVQNEPVEQAMAESAKPVTAEIVKPKVRVICWKFTDAWYNRHENYKLFNLPQELNASIACYNQVKYIKNVSIMVIDGQQPIALSNY